MHILFLLHDPISQNKLVLIFHDANGHPEFYRFACLSFLDPPRMRFEYGIDLFVRRNSFSLQNSPIRLSRQETTAFQKTLDLPVFFRLDLLFLPQPIPRRTGSLQDVVAGLQISLDLVETAVRQLSGANGKNNFRIFFSQW